MTECTCAMDLVSPRSCPVGIAIGKHPIGSWLDNNGELHLPDIRMRDAEPLRSIEVSIKHVIGQPPTKVVLRLNDHDYDLSSFANAGVSDFLAMMYEAAHEAFGPDQGDERND